MSNALDSSASALPRGSFMRLSQILGDREKGIEPIIPVSRSTWFKGVADGRFPQSVKLAKRVAVWRTSDIKKLVDSL